MNRPRTVQKPNVIELLERRGTALYAKRKAARFGRLCLPGPDYLAMRYVRSPASFLDDSMASPSFFATVPLMKPRMLWFSHCVAFAISATVAPSFRRWSSRTISFFVPAASRVGFNYQFGFGRSP